MRGDRRPAYEFGPFRLNVAEQLLLRDGQRLPLTPKVFDILRVLVQNSGHLVEKERLLAAVWPDSFVEEGALSRSISILRKTLDGDGSGQKYIETVPKRGYRFVASVTEWMPDNPEALVEPTGRTAAVADARPSSIPDDPTAKPDWLRAAGWMVGAIGLLVVASALAGLGRSSRETSERKTNGLTAPAPAHRQVTFTGKERTPTISPDGKRIAYVSYEKPEKKLVVQELAGGQPLTIFTAPELGHLRWSPDGNDLIVWTRGSAWNGVYVLSQLGGTPRRIAPDLYIACWSPDSSAIAVGSYLNGRIWFFDRFGRLQRTVLLRDVKGSIEDMNWSTNDVLTVVSRDNQGGYTLWTVRPDGSDQRRVLVADSEISSARWAPDGNAIYYFRRQNQTFSLLKVPVSAGGETQLAPSTTLVAGLESDQSFALSGDARRLVYARAPYYSNLWLVDTNGGHNRRAELLELTHGTSLIERPSISPDGTSVVFNIGHEPVTNLYKMPITGGAPKQLTFFNSFNLGGVWSADGERIAFASTEGGQQRVWALDAGGGVPQPLPSSDMSDTFDLTWSPGSRILYQQSGNRNYYELDADTRTQRFLVNDGSGGWIFSPAYSPDGRKIAVRWTGPRNGPSRGIWVIDATDRSKRLVYRTSAASSMPVGWSADGGSIYVLEGKNLNYRGMTAFIETLTEAKIVRVPANGGDVKPVTVLPFEEIGGVSLTPDGRRVVCVVYSSRSDVWVVDNFDVSR